MRQMLRNLGAPLGRRGGIVSVVLSLASTVLVSAGLVSGWLLPTPARSRLKRFLRPPAARAETEFLSLKRGSKTWVLRKSMRGRGENRRAGASP